MRLQAILGLLAALAAAGPGRAYDGPALLASAPVDASVFRDGEVRRSAVLFGSWTLVCDTIARLGHKFCSLRSAPVALGSARLELVVSTGDDGRPAALVRLPFGLWLPFGLAVEPLGSVHAPARHVPIALCGGTGCEAVWTLRSDEIAALRTGPGLRIVARSRSPAVSDVAAASGTTTAVLSGVGFADAVAASLK